MSPFLKALPFAALLTALFALRFRMWRSPRVLIAYFVFFLGLHWAAEAWALPPQAFGWEMSAVLTGLTGVLVVLIVLIDRHERRHPGED